MHRFFNNLFRPVLFFDQSGGGGGGASKKEPTGDDEKKTAAGPSQEELNKQFAERAKSAASAKEKEILELLGVTDPEEAKKLIEAARKSEADNQSELEKEKIARAKAEADAEKAKQEADQAKADALKLSQDTEIKFSALDEVKDKDGKVTRPAFRKDAIDDVLLLIDRTGINAKDGKTEGVEDALSKLAKAKPYLLVDLTKQPKGKGTPGEDGKKKKADGEVERTPLIRRL